MATGQLRSNTHTLSRPLSRRAWVIATLAWFLFAFVQSPGLISADTKLDLVSGPWGFLSQALAPWTDVFPLGQLQNQAYGYLFPHGIFFALLSWLPAWVVQRLWWGLLLAIAFSGMVLLAERVGVGSRGSRITAGILYALSPRILSTLGAISSEAWPVALAPWVLVPMVGAIAPHVSAELDPEAAHRSGLPPLLLTKNRRTQLATAALLSAVAVLLMGAVNAVATAAAVLPAAIWWCGALLRHTQRKQAAYFGMWWIPAGLLACFWWIGPLLVLGMYSPPFTDYIESAGLTTRWSNLLEVLRGTTSWVPFLSTERVAGHALVQYSVFVVATLLVAFIGLYGLARIPSSCRPSRGAPEATAEGTGAWRWVAMLFLGVTIFLAAVEPFSPVAGTVRDFLDGPGAALRNLHKFDPLVRLPLMIGLAAALGTLRWPGKSRARWAEFRHPEKYRSVVQVIAVSLLIALATAPGWSGRIAAADPYRAIPSYWVEAADYLNSDVTGPASTAARTMILPDARFGRQTWGNTRDEPAQPLLNVPWVVRDSVPLVQPEAIRALDGISRELHSGTSQAALAGTLWNQGIGHILVRQDLTQASDTPGSTELLKTLDSSPGFHRETEFGVNANNRPAIIIFRVQPNGVDSAQAGSLRLVDRDQVEVVSAGPEAMPRLDAADAALGRTAPPRTRVLIGDAHDPNIETNAESSVSSDNTVSENSDIKHGTPLFGNPQTSTDTPALRDHNYGNVTNADSAIRAPSDESSVLNPVRDYPVSANGSPLDAEAMTHVRESAGRIVSSSSADDPTSFGGAHTIDSVTAAVDGNPRTAWRPATGHVSGQYLEFQLDDTNPRHRLDLTLQGTAAKIQVAVYNRTTDDHGAETSRRIIATSTEVVQPNKLTRIDAPTGYGNTIRVTIISAFGDIGISEAKVLIGEDSPTDVTPRRNIIVPSLTEGTSNELNRWIFGQEIPEFEMQRTFTVPRDLPVVIHAPDCQPEGGKGEHGHESQSTEIATIDGASHACGDVINLTAGKHELRTEQRWIALTAAEPLYAAAIRQTQEAQPLSAESLDNDLASEMKGKTTPQILYSPSQANPGRTALLDFTDTHDVHRTVHLAPLTINGWQQGWVIPTELVAQLQSAHDVRVELGFAGTALYRSWLLVGAGAAVVLLLLTATLVWGTRKQRGSRHRVTQWQSAESASHSLGVTVASSNPIKRPLTRAGAIALVVPATSATTALVGASHGPWGQPWYAGDSWIVNIALVILLLAVPVTRIFATCRER